jgi:hypothetical protein
MDSLMNPFIKLLDILNRWKIEFAATHAPSPVFERSLYTVSEFGT